MILKLDGRFTKQAKGVFGKYEFSVGILEDRPHKNAAPAKKGLGSYAGGPVRKTTNTSTQSISSVSEDLRKHIGINFYTVPFNSKKNRDLLKFVDEFFALCAGRGEVRRAINFLQAIVRNPILRGDYGKNSKVTKKIKGFDRFMIDTGQLFKALTAKVTVKRVS
jgi:hypothetical protein